jgi:hypothetical protein
LLERAPPGVCDPQALKDGLPWPPGTRTVMPTTPQLEQPRVQKPVDLALDVAQAVPLAAQGPNEPALVSAAAALAKNPLAHRNGRPRRRSPKTLNQVSAHSFDLPSIWTPVSGSFQT